MQYVKLFKIMLLAFILIGSAQADTDVFKLYEVKLPDPNDTLNARQAPKADAPVNFVIPNNTLLISRDEETKVGNATWLKIYWQGFGFGSWVNKKYLKSSELLSKFQPVTNKALPVFKCVGTEPFWNFNIKDNRIQGENFADSSRYQEAITQKLVSPDKKIYLVKSTKLDFLMKKSGTCGDGMSEKDYTYDAYIILPHQQFLIGCCD